MYGAIIGDIVGSKYEFRNIKTKHFPLFAEDCDYTDDTIMTAAVAKAILRSRERIAAGDKEKSFFCTLVDTMQELGRRYPFPMGAYGGQFSQWLRNDDPKPYGSFGNGSAMRVSPCGLAAVTLEEALVLARISACVTHNHPEGIRGAEATAAAVFLARQGRTKDEIRAYISEYYYKLDFTLDAIRDSYRFDGSCQGSVPQAITAFLESEDFEDAIRNVISIGGDCDTTGAITGSIAWTFYRTPFAPDFHTEADVAIREKAKTYLPEEFRTLADEFAAMCAQRAGTFDRVGMCTPICVPEEEKKFLTDWEIPWEAPL